MGVDSLTRDWSIMRTPWGELKSLDLNNLALCEEILATDKHQLLEGLVIERFFDDILREMSTFTRISILDIDTAVCLHEGQFHVFILARELTIQLKNLFNLLGRKMVTHLVQYIEGDLYCCRVENGKKTTEIIELGVFLDLYYGSNSVNFTVNQNVRDESRQQTAFWNHIVSHYGDSVGRKIVLPRLFINHGIQTHFRAVWNLDRIILMNGDFWVMEVKHKYPIRSGISLKFGLNVGELNVLESVVDCGLRCFHSLVVKPIWNKSVGSMYLMDRPGLMQKALLIGCELDKRMIEWVNSSDTGISAAHTSITGNGQLRYKSIPVEGFNEVGVLSDPVRVLAVEMHGVMKGGGVVVNASTLLNLKIG